jgi:fructokinase
MKHIIGLGEIVWDLLPTGKQLGGAPANFAYHAQAIGLKTVKASIISSIGDDVAGREIQSQLTALAINQDYLAIDKTHQTGSVAVTLDELGNPHYCIAQAVAWDFIPAIPKRLINQVDAICFGTLAQRSRVSANAIINFLKQLPRKSLRVFDINLRQTYYTAKIIHQSLKYANVVKINEDELRSVATLFNLIGDETDLLRQLCERYQLQLCILTKGNQGSVLLTSSKILTHQGFNVKVNETVGAGDAFTAAIAVGLLNGFELEYIHDCANRLAAFVCTSSGAMPKLTAEIINLFSCNHPE